METAAQNRDLFRSSVQFYEYPAARPLMRTGGYAYKAELVLLFVMLVTGRSGSAKGLVTAKLRRGQA